MRWVRAVEDNGLTIGPVSVRFRLIAGLPVAGRCGRTGYQMRILIVGLNYAPEPVGIGPYTSEMAEALAAAGHVVEVVAAEPYYPAWARPAGARRWRYTRSVQGGVRVVRCPIYVPAQPSGAKRILHHFSFALSLIPPLLASLRRRPNLMISIAPSLISAPIARLLASLRGVPTWLHIQDFEVGAAVATGLIDPNSLTGRLASGFEGIAQAGFNRYSSISPQMCRRLVASGIDAAKVIEVRNWSDISAVQPMTRPSEYRALWRIGTPHVALYSGNIANKQGVGVIVEAAKRLRHRDDLTFVICGEGANKAALVESAKDLPNIRFHPLQPRERLGELLGLATIHLLPQLARAADLVLPSKLTNMLASGRPVVATAAPGTGLAEELDGCGAITPPGDDAAFADAIVALMESPVRFEAASRAARDRAENIWSKDAILARLEHRVRDFAPAASC